MVSVQVKVTVRLSTNERRGEGKARADAPARGFHMPARKCACEDRGMGDRKLNSDDVDDRCAVRMLTGARCGGDGGNSGRDDGGGVGAH